METISIAFEKARGIKEMCSASLAKNIDKTQMERASVDILSYLLGSFPLTNEDHTEAIRVIFERREALDMAYLESLQPCLVPVAIMRDLTKATRIRFDYLDIFSEFTRRYNAMMKIDL